MIRLIFIVFLFAIAGNLQAQKFGLYTLYGTQGGTATRLVDTNGVVFKTWNHGTTARTAYSSYLTPGKILWRSVINNGNQFTGGGMSGRVQKVDWNGTVLWDFTYSSATYCLHHDICPLPNGNVLLISYDLHSAAEATQAGANSSIIVWSDKIIEVHPTGPTTGDIVWEWRAWDHLVQNTNPTKDNYETSIVQHPERLNINYKLTKDWLHMNGLDYNPISDQIAFSAHNLNEWYVIDHSTSMAEAASSSGGNSGRGGNILFRWGNPQAYQATGTPVLNVTHDAHWIPEGCPNEGRLVGYNNRGISSPANRSTIDQIVPPKNGYVFDYTPGQAMPPTTYNSRIACNGYSSNMSNSQQLPNGNTLYTIALSGAIYEVNAAGQTVWSKTDIGSGVPQAFRYTECFVNADAIPNPVITAQGDTLISTEAATYQWYKNGEKIPGAISQTHLANDAGIYLVRVTYSNGCEYYYQYSQGFKVTQNFPLAVTATSVLDTVCAGENVALLAQATGGTATTTFQWSSIPAGFSSTLPNPVANPTVTTVYKVVATNGTESDSATVSISVNPLPTTPTIEQDVNNLTSSVGHSYVWYFNGTLQPTFTTQTISPTQNGNYQVQIVDQNGCKSAFSEAINFIYTGVKSALFSGDIQVFPNPSNGIFQLNVLAEEVKSAAITDLQGRKILQLNQTNQIDLSAFANGIYQLKLETIHHQNFIFKLIKTK